MTQRINWLDNNEGSSILERVKTLDHFVDSLADGKIDKDEIAAQNQRVTTAMKAVQDLLSDEQHEKVTTLLVEVAAMSMMQILHELAAMKPRPHDPSF